MKAKNASALRAFMASLNHSVV